VLLKASSPHSNYCELTGLIGTTMQVHGSCGRNHSKKFIENLLSDLALFYWPHASFAKLTFH
ncbi:MAG: hypothetical protein R3245_07120, partial [Kiloniellales bacterium]|nr:hypothetical protein [Kiloniellales bacterium]